GGGAQSTNFSKRQSNSFWGSSHRPVCVWELCRMVLRFAVNHPKRSDGSRAPIGPEPGSPAPMDFHALRWSIRVSAPTSGAKLPNLSGWIWNFMSRNFFRWQYRMTPILKNSPRSTLGTIRMIAYLKVCLSCIFGFFYQKVHHGQFGRDELDIGRPDLLRAHGIGLVLQPLFGHGRYDFHDLFPIEGPENLLGRLGQ